MKFGITRKRFHEIIFEADTKAGKAFDIALLICIIISVIVVMLDSVNLIRTKHHDLLLIFEIVFTVLFTIEYFLRIWAIKKPVKYIFSFFGIVDLLAILPTYLSLILVGSHSLIVIRVIRLLRIFRILKLGRYISASQYLIQSLRTSRHKIFVFLWAVLTVVVIMGTLMYIIESPDSGFTDIPRGIYWAIVTLTTVGYGDIAPVTPLGQIISSFVMILGYAIIAVPTGIITAEIINRKKTNLNTQTCLNCHKTRHDDDALYCKKCGEEL